MAAADPHIPDWRQLTLPDTWPDRLDLRKPADLWRFLQHILGRHTAPVQLPADLPGADNIPKYILQEFHNLPNGNYSRRFTRGYITGFNKVMLGEITQSHQRMARQLASDPTVSKGSVLDVGCGGGGLAGALQQAGVRDVWGLDPSPYLLKHAATDWPDIHFVQGVAENTGFPDQRFQAITACFLLHEIPPRYLQQCLAEFARILTPGGWLALCEPSPLQAENGLIPLWQTHGWRGIYFYTLARFVHEPFLAAWHRQDLRTLLDRYGFDVIGHERGLPMQHWLARKR